MSATRIDLAWEAPGGFTIEGYRIEVSADGGNTWTDLVARTDSTDTTYSHTGLADGDTRHYRVSAIFGSDEALASNVASATTMDSTPPRFVRADTDNGVGRSGRQISLAFTEALDGGAGRTAPASAFTVTADGSSMTVTGVEVALAQYVKLTLAPRITRGQTVKVSYRDPTEGDDLAAIQDIAGNDAASFAEQGIENSSAILGAPTNLTATAVSATRIDLAWEAPGGFTPEGYRIEVSADGGNTWTDLVARTDSTDTTYSHTGLADGDTRHYRVSAIFGGDEALASNVASATSMATDTTPPGVLDSPGVQTVTSSGVELQIAFTEALDDTTGQTPPASAFAVAADGSSITVTGVEVTGNRVTLDLGRTISRDQTVTVSYEDPTSSDDTAAVQDAAGNDAASFTDYPITNNSRVLRGPTNLRTTRRSLNWIDLSWEAPTDFVPEEYRVEGTRYPADPWRTLVNANDDPTDTVFSHYDALPDPDPIYTWRYRVWAVSSTVESVVSNVGTAGADRVPPVFTPEDPDTGASSDGTNITLDFSEILLGGVGKTPPWSAFTVTVDGIPVQQGRAIAGFDEIRLTGFESPIGGGRVVRVSYQDPTPGDDQAAIQDLAGNDAASLHRCGDRERFPGAAGADEPEGGGARRYADRPRLERAGPVRDRLAGAYPRARYLRLPDRGVRRWRHDLDHRGAHR